tara:strand:- start:6150 stop:7016 length:867 start_codon:yes stop_codon:yes gene_type:complete
MNNLIFITHATLYEKHADWCLNTLLSKQTDDIAWDNFVIYNTHEDEVSNEFILDLIKKYDVNRYVKNILIFPYDTEIYKKTLNQDIKNWFTILVENGLNQENGKTVFLKSDYCVSNNFNEIVKLQQNNDFQWSLPIYNAKERLSFDDIQDRLSLETFIAVDDKTYYRGGDNQSGITPLGEVSPNGEMDYHPSIDYVSHNYQNDYNLHVYSNNVLQIGYDLLHNLDNNAYNLDSTWGGAHNLFAGMKFYGVKHLDEIRCFGVHMFHEVKSANRDKDRGDKRKIHSGERY